MRPRLRLSTLVLPLLALPSVLAGNGVLYTESVTYCAEAKAVIVEEFDIAYHQSNGSVVFTFSLASVEANLNVSANIYLNAYGIDIVNQTVDLCSYFEGVICPLPQVNFTGYGTYPIPKSYTSKIPGIAYSVPNLEAYARVELIRDGSGEVAACLQATLSNGHSTRHKAVAWATGMFTLVALIIGLLHTGLSSSPSPSQYRWFDILYLFQTAAATGLLHLNYPLVYSNFAENFAWSIAMLYSSKMQSSINRMRMKTGGHLSGLASHEVQYIDRKLSPFNDYISLNGFPDPPAFGSYLAEIPSGNTSAVASIPRSLSSRGMITSTIDQNGTNELDTGLPVYSETLSIPDANAFSTVFFFFLAFVAIAIAFHVLLFGVVWVWDRAGRGRKTLWVTKLRQMWWGFCAGNALRLCLIWFLPIWIFALWQFHIGDSKLAIFFAVFAILLTLVPLATMFILSIFKNRRLSSTAPTISPLYTSYRWFHSVGVLYRPYRERFHFFWFAPLVLAMIARGGFIALGPENARAQVIGNVVVEAIVLVAILACRPHKDRKGDWLAAFLSFCRLCAFGLLIAFIPTVRVAPIPRTVIGFVIIVVFGIPTILLFFGLIWNAGYGYWWRRHTHRIEDGLEIERFVAADDESEEPAMQHVDAGNFVSAAPAASRKGSSGQSLNRRTSIIEPIDNVYEPSLGSHHYPSNSSHGHQLERYDDSQSSPRLATPIDPAAAYAYAASGRGVHGEEEDSPHARTMSPVVSASGRPLSGQSLYHSSGSGFTSPIADEGRHRYSNGYGNARY